MLVVCPPHEMEQQHVYGEACHSCLVPHELLTYLYIHISIYIFACVCKRVIHC